MKREFKEFFSKSSHPFEQRQDQIEMAETIWEAFEDDQIALIEAGTGIGKSLAYLLPTLLWSHQTGQKVVISTYTIALQEQLLEKDIPLLLNLLDLPLKVRLVKGMGNYLCLRKLEDPLVQHQLGPHASKLVEWAEKTSDGTQSDLSLTSQDWQKVQAESKRCSYGRCPHFRRCFFFEARSALVEADILIVNHHLLLADMQSAGQQRILPEYKRLVLDEAHHFEEVALSSLTEGLSMQDLWRPLARIHSESATEGSRLSLLSKGVHHSASLHARLSIDLPAQHLKLAQTIQKAFQALPVETRIREQTLAQTNWESAKRHFEELITELKRYSSSLSSLKNEISDKTLENVLFEIQSAAEELDYASEFLKEFFHASYESSLVRWTQNNRGALSLSQAHLNVSDHLQTHLFAPLKTVVLCSATLSVGKKFSHLSKRLGFNEENLLTRIYPSPFDYKNQTLLLASSDFPEPSHPDFLPIASQAILSAMKACKGGAFLLFTSYDQLNQCYEKIAGILQQRGLLPLRQGELGRFALLQAFKQHENAVLFGTDSFWEGVDVPGRALRCVIIVKLPFKVPSDPLVEAQAEQLKKEGGDPFFEQAIPQAIVKFKQGFGRLMRQKGDRGSVLCLDRRILTKPYGRLFLDSLPETLIHFGKKEEIFQEMEKFHSLKN